MASSSFRKPFARSIFAAALVAGAVGFAGTAHADTTHVVGRGHTLQAIANRYHVTVHAILEANPSVDPRHLRIGETLTIPNGKSGGSSAKSASSEPKAHDHGKHETHSPASYTMRPKQPHVVHATRLNNGEAITLTTSDRKGKVPAKSLKSMENLMRSSGNAAHDPDPRLIALFGVVSDHFGGRKIEVVSGYRPYSPTQHTAHSNHNVGKAIDFRVVGVPNEVLRDFCKTLHNVGCGYYPNSTFVHMDVRATNAFWIDYSKPGEAPNYDAPGSAKDADDSTSDVADEANTDGGAGATTMPSDDSSDEPAPSSPTASTAGASQTGNPSPATASAITAAAAAPANVPVRSAGTSPAAPVTRPTPVTTPAASQNATTHANTAPASASLQSAATVSPVR